MRQFIRHPSDIPIEYNLVDVVEHTEESLMNISEGGLCFRSKDPIDSGSAIHIKISIHKPEFEAKGIVVWCRRTNGHYDVGVSFSDTHTEFRVRMVEQVCYIEQYKKEVLEKEGGVLSGKEAAFEWIEKHANSFPR